jgi:hypothetical protein
MSVLISILRAIVLLMIMLIIVAVGWNEPIRYRFMSADEIFRTENPPTPPPIVHLPPPAVPAPLASPTPKPGGWMWDANRTGNPLQLPPSRP